MLSVTRANSSAVSPPVAPGAVSVIAVSAKATPPGSASAGVFAHPSIVTRARARWAWEMAVHARNRARETRAACRLPSHAARGMMTP